MLTTLLVALIGAGGTIIAGYLIYRTNRQDRTLNQIEINVNSRLDRLLDQSRLDNIELGSLRPPNDEPDDDPTTSLNEPTV